MSKVYSLNGWEKYQHYGKRESVPWVKLHRDTLTSLAWIKGNDLARVVMVGSMALAARYQNAIPLDWDLLKAGLALRCSEKQFMDALRYLEASGFIAFGKRDASKRLEQEEERRGDLEETPRSPQGGEAYSEEFERWWASFPNQTGKGAAWKAWDKAFIRVDLQTLIDAAKRYAQTKPDDRQWCNPSKWLRENRWEDAPPASTTAEPAEPEGDLRWRLRVQGFTKNGFWNRDLWGPAPGEKGCQAPSALVIEFNADGLTPPSFLARKTG